MLQDEREAFLCQITELKTRLEEAQKENEYLRQEKEKADLNCKDLYEQNCVLNGKIQAYENVFKWESIK